MPGSTAQYGLPYPLDGELQIAADIKNLADGVEDLINNYLSPKTVVLSAMNSWVPNSVVPITLTIYGKLVVCTGEVYKASGITTTEQIALIPEAYRPNTERVRAAAFQISTSPLAYVSAYDDGRLEIINAGPRSTTPGYNWNLVWNTA